MEKFAELISILLQHSERFFEFWNLQLLVSLAVLGFIFSEPKVAAKRFIRSTITGVFLLIAVFTIYSLYPHQQREEKLYKAIESRVMVSPADYTPEELAYLKSLKPTPFGIKAGALLVADALIIAVTWITPQMIAKPDD